MKLVRDLVHAVAELVEIDLPVPIFIDVCDHFIHLLGRVLAPNKLDEIFLRDEAFVVQVHTVEGLVQSLLSVPRPLPHRR